MGNKTNTFFSTLQETDISPPLKKEKNRQKCLWMGYVSSQEGDEPKKTCHKKCVSTQHNGGQKTKEHDVCSSNMSISVCLKVIHLGPLKIHTRIKHWSLEFEAIYLNFSDLTHIHPSPPAINLFVGARKGVDLEMGFPTDTKTPWLKLHQPLVANSIKSSEKKKTSW